MAARYRARKKHGLFWAYDFARTPLTPHLHDRRCSLRYSTPRDKCYRSRMRVVRGLALAQSGFFIAFGVQNYRLRTVIYSGSRKFTNSQQARGLML